LGGVVISVLDNFLAAFLFDVFLLSFPPDPFIFLSDSFSAFPFFPDFNLLCFLEGAKTKSFPRTEYWTAD
jgi:hypothetical protein